MLYSRPTIFSQRATWRAAHRAMRIIARCMRWRRARALRMYSSVLLVNNVTAAIKAAAINNQTPSPAAT